MVQKYKGNLELNWINKDKSLYYEYDQDGNPGKPIWVEKNDIRVSEPRILKLVKEYGDTSELKDPLDNALIRGDNLLALKTLVEMFKERDEKDKIKCVFIDPPYNTGNAFEQYEDNLQRSEWLTMMRDRLLLLKKILRKDGSIWISIDDAEVHYLKILCDEIFGSNNFMGTVIWQHSIQGKGYSGKLSVHHNYILVYRISEFFEMNELPREEKHNVNYSNPDNDPNGRWRTGDVRNSLYRPNLIYDIKTPSGKIISPPEKGWRWSKETVAEKIKTGEIIFSKDEKRIIRKIYLKNQQGRVPETIWFGEDVGTTRTANAEQKEIFKNAKMQLFATPKPEKLIERITMLTSKENDIILDSFLGSGTTSAVAHKMNRRWIGIEIGKHAETHCVKRMNIILDENKTKAKQKTLTDDSLVNTKGFRYYKLGDSLINDSRMNWDLTYEEISQALFMNFDYRFKEKITTNAFLGKSGKNLAICIVAKDMKIIKKDELEKILSKIKQSSNTQIVIYTNHGVAIKNQDLPENISIKKIPETILRKYKL